MNELQVQEIIEALGGIKEICIINRLFLALIFGGLVGALLGKVIVTMVR